MDYRGDDHILTIGHIGIHSLNQPMTITSTHIGSLNRIPRYHYHHQITKDTLMKLKLIRELEQQGLSLKALGKGKEVSHNKTPAQLEAARKASIRMKMAWGC